MIHFDHDLSRNENNIYVACSGGIDSIAILHFLKKKNIKAFHFNHKFREQNDHMESSVRRFTDDFNIPLEVRSRKETDKIKEGDSIEAKAREWRLHAINEIGGTFIMCHHLDDCVESYLMNCFNGHPERKPIPKETRLENAKLIRPILYTSKQDLEEYVEKNDLGKYIVEDETNTDTSYRRNAIRLSIIPTISKEYKGMRKVVKKFMKRKGI